MQGLGRRRHLIFVENKGKLHEIEGRIGSQVIPTLDGRFYGKSEDVERRGGPIDLALARPTNPGPADLARDRLT
jgi:hypothetical protein